MSVAHDGSKANDGGNLSKQLRYKLRTSLFVLNCGEKTKIRKDLVQ